MDLSKYLVSTQLMDCTGKVTHTLTLLPDGMVEIETGAVKAVVNPQTKSVLRPPGVRFADTILDQARVLAREAFG